MRDPAPREGVAFLTSPDALLSAPLARGSPSKPLEALQMGLDTNMPRLLSQALSLVFAVAHARSRTPLFADKPHGNLSPGVPVVPGTPV